MKIHKTKQEKRNVYRYPMEVPDSHGGYRREYITIRPGENGVTEEDIRILHAMDDSEVYSNLKNLRPERTEDEREAIAVWRQEWILSFENRYGYIPGKELADQAVAEAFPKNWNLSFDYLASKEESAVVKNMALRTPDVCPWEDNPAADRLYEVLDDMPERQKTAFRLVKLDGYTLTAAADVMGISVPGVKKLVDKAVTYVRRYF